MSRLPAYCLVCGEVVAHWGVCECDRALAKNAQANADARAAGLTGRCRRCGSRFPDDHRCAMR